MVADPMSVGAVDQAIKAVKGLLSKFLDGVGLKAEADHALLIGFDNVINSILSIVPVGGTAVGELAEWLTSKVLNTTSITHNRMLFGENNALIFRVWAPFIVLPFAAVDVTINLDTGRATIDGSAVSGGARPGNVVENPRGRVTGTFSVPDRK